jgi:hypothetical protein
LKKQLQRKEKIRYKHEGDRGREGNHFPVIQAKQALIKEILTLRVS